MRKFKYIILIAITCLISIGIYEYIDANKPVEIKEDILAYQSEIEKANLADTNFSINDPKVILNLYGNSPLTAVIIFQTKDLTAPEITVKGKDGSKDITHTFIPSKTHILPIYGLYAGYDNKVTITASGITKKLTITTNKLPDDFIQTNSINKNFETDDLYFATPTDKGYTAAYDTNGEVRWYLIGDYKWDIQRLNNGHILLGNNKLIKKPNYSIGLTEMDLLGKVYYEYNIPGGYHHDVYEMNNGNLLLASNNFDSGTLEDYLVEIDRNTGEVVKTIDLYSIMPNNYGENWFKISSLAYDEKTNSLTISGYNRNILINIDYASSEINYIIGDPKNVPQNLKKYVLNADILPNKPEGVNILSNGDIIYITSIDNKKMLVTYHIENKKITITNKEELSNNEDAYLDILGDNHYLITQGKKITEIENSKEIMSIDTSSNIYNAKKMSLYANDVYTNAQGQRIGKIGETKKTNNYSLLSAKNEDIINKYNINIVKDAYGLQITGNFNKNSKVQIILDNVLSKYTYDMEKTNNTYYKFINEEGINGKYYIYLKIDKKIYKLHKYAIFYWSK